jgi:multisubunit Na+/H+ antiporter MnhB subunit
VNVDTELEAWRQEWREQTAPLPELRRKIRKQNVRTIAAVIAIGVCLIFATAAAVRYHSAMAAGVAVGIAFSSLVLGFYTLRARRGAWKPTAQTTLAYAELAHRRAVAKLKTIRAAWYLLIGTIVAGAVLMAWGWRHVHVRDEVIFAALIGELFLLKNRERRVKREIAETKKLIEGLTE